VTVDSTVGVEFPNKAEALEGDSVITGDSELPVAVTKTDDVSNKVVMVSLPLLGAEEVSALDGLGE
jgi:hypothetical protein